MPAPTCIIYNLDAAQQQALIAMLSACSFRERQMPYALISVEGDGFNCTLYERERHGRRKCCIQGQKAQEFALFYMEPQVIKEARLGYEDVLDPGRDAPHIGSDESGKGDWFGPLVVACVYVDERVAKKMREMNVRDCKKMSDKAVLTTGAALRNLLGPKRFSVVKFGNPAYNRCYARMHSLNRMLAWAHACAIEETLEKQPYCKRGVIDQFANDEETMLRALKPRGKTIRLEQRHKAESDIAVAAASIIARETFLRDIQAMETALFGPEPEGGRGENEHVPIGSSSPRVRELGVEMVAKNGPV